jgi:hypothetical protein
MRIRAGGIVLFALYLLACGRRTVGIPKGLPDGSVVLDNVKYVVFARCAPALGLFYDCDIFGYDATLAFRARYQLVGGDRFNPLDPSEYAGGDECQISLSRGRSLVCAEPPRPAGVPNTAIWRSHGCGAFVDCSTADETSNCVCTLYDDMSGDRAVSNTIHNGESCELTLHDVAFWCTYEGNRRNYHLH